MFQWKKDPNKNKLKKVLGLAFGISIVVGGTVGLGIFEETKSIAAHLPNVSLILFCWLLIGLYILLCANSYAELTTMLPEAGGAFNYTKKAFGAYIGFVTGWFDFTLNVLAPAFICLALGQCVGRLFHDFEVYDKQMAFCLLTLFTFINLVGIKTGDLTQQITSSVKIVLVLVLVAGCFMYASRKHDSSIISQTKSFNNIGLTSFFAAIQSILAVYDGWTSVSFFAAEDKNPSKNVPRSYFWGILTIIIVYLSINAAIHAILPIQKVVESKLAASDAAVAVFGPKGFVVFNVIYFFSGLSILNAYMMIPSHILYGLSKEGFFITEGQILNKGGTPYISLIMCYFLACAFLFFNTPEQLFNLIAFMVVIVLGLALASLLRLRRTLPNLPRPYKAWGYPHTTLVALAMTVTLTIGFAISDSRSAIIIGAAFPFFYFLYRLMQKRNTPTK